jgi:hypothetical protein
MARIDTYGWFYLSSPFAEGSGPITYIVEYQLPAGGIPAGVCKYLTGGTARKLVTTISGLDYLNGQIVTVASDGKFEDQYVVSGGSITLNRPAATVHVGLSYSWTVQFLPLGGDGQTVNQGKERKLFDVVLRIYKSLGGQFGKDVNKLYPINYTAIENINRNTDDDVLFTGDLHKVGFESSMLDYWTPVLTDDKPFPFQLLAAVLRSEINEEK